MKKKRRRKCNANNRNAQGDAFKYYGRARRTHHTDSGAPTIVQLNSSTFPESTKAAKSFWTPFITAACYC